MDTLPPMKELPTLQTDEGPIDMNALVVIDEVNLERSYRIQAPWTAFFIWQHGLRKVNVSRQKAKLKQVTAQCWLEHKMAATKGVTAAQVDALTESDPRVLAENEKLNELMIEANRWYSAVQAWSERSTMLVQIGAERRSSMKNL